MDTPLEHTPETGSDAGNNGSGALVWVLLNHIHADKREQFEWLLRDVIGLATQRSRPAAASHVRTLTPTEQNDDGSYTYIFVMDPLVEAGDYDIGDLLTQQFGQEQALAYLE